MNTAELTTLHAETLNAARFERTLANIARRAETLFDNGYSAIQDNPHFYTVLTPQEGRYTVHINDDAPSDDVFGNWCTCPAHESYGTCKHLQAILLQRAADASLETQSAQYDALMASAETSAGCDAWAEL